ncbi:MAG: CHASE2 domain-containing protein [Cyanobacteria bacterium P01_F01_bin.150]
MERWSLDYRRAVATTRALKPIEIRYPASVDPTDSCRQSAKFLKQEFGDWVQSDGFHAVTQTMLRVLQISDHIRILIRTNDRRLHRLPWHSWDLLEQFPFAEVALGATSFWMKPVVTRKSKEKVRILAILGDSTGIDVETDRGMLATLPKTDVTFLVEPRRKDLSDTLWAQPWDVLFFAGHSSTQEETGVLRINRDEYLGIEDLKYGLDRAISQGLQLAIFNSCDGLGLAYELEALQLPQLIVMREPVSDRVAHEFLTNFLRYFVDPSQTSTYMAVRQAREKLQGLDKQFLSPTWLPIIFQNSLYASFKWRYPEEEAISTKRASRTRLINYMRTLLIVSLAMSLLVFWARWQGRLQPFELKAFDHMMQQRPIYGADERIVVIGVTEDDIEKLDQPFEETGQGARTLSDQTIENLIAILLRENPSVIALDFLRQGSINEKRYPVFSRTVKNGELITLCYSSGSPSSPQIAKAPDEALPEGVGIAKLLTDEDEVIRRHLVYTAVRDKSICKKSKDIPSLSLNASLRYLWHQFKIEREEKPQDDFIKIGDIKINPFNFHRGGYHKKNLEEMNNTFQIVLNYRPYQYKQDIAKIIPITSVFNDPSIVNDIENKIILIGYVDSGKDNHLTPFKHESLERLPGVLIHAQIISQILDIVEKRRPTISALHPSQDFLLIWMISFSSGTLLKARLRSFHQQKTFIVSMLIFWVIISHGLCLLLLTYGCWLPYIPITSSTFFTLIGMSYYLYSSRSK